MELVRLSAGLAGTATREGGSIVAADAMQEKSLADQLLDIVLFAPAGLAMTIADEMPNLAAKGRARIDGQVATARVVGQFAVQMGRQLGKKQLEGLLGQLVGLGASRGSADGSPQAEGGTSSGGPAADRSGPAADRSGQAADRSGPAADRSGPAADRSGPAADRSGPGAPSERTSGGARGPSSSAPGDPERLGIPGYDTLSASQVVQRLGGLSASELEAVRAHEIANRHRRTILNRVEQYLEASGDD